MNPYETPGPLTPASNSNVDRNFEFKQFELQQLAPNPSVVKQSAITFSLVILALNILILAVALTASGWATLNIYIIGVLLNLIIGMIGLAMIPGISKQAQGASLAIYISVIVVLPFAAILAGGCIVRMFG